MKLAVLFSAVACLTASALFFGVRAFRGGAVEAAAAQPRVHAAAPTAVEFARALAGTANQFSAAAQVTHPDCVQAAPGRYMCSYGLVRNGREECHIMQGRWTPDSASTITVTLAGRAKRCGSLREALHSLD
jgi:acyl-CoA thioester hydrolase